MQRDKQSAKKTMKIPKNEKELSEDLSQKENIKQSYIYYSNMPKTPPKKTSEKFFDIISENGIDDDEKDKNVNKIGFNVSANNVLGNNRTNNKVIVGKRRNRNSGLRVIFTVIILLAICSIIMTTLRKMHGHVEVEENTFDVNARDGVIQSRSSEQLQAIMSKFVDYDDFYLSINQTPVFEDGESYGPLWIENIPANHFNTKVSIVIDKTGQEVIKTGMIKPNQYIESAKLNTKLEKGTYLATAKFTIINPQTLENTGSAEVKITITVEK